MLTSKQRAYLRGLANTKNAIFQIGKGGVTDEIVSEIRAALEKRELIKVTVLETAFMTPREACSIVCEKIGAEAVQCIGNKFVIYKESRDNKEIILPR